MWRWDQFARGHSHSSRVNLMSLVTRAADNTGQKLTHCLLLPKIPVTRSSVSVLLIKISSWKLTFVSVRRPTCREHNKSTFYSLGKLRFFSLTNFNTGQFTSLWGFFSQFYYSWVSDNLWRTAFQFRNVWSELHNSPPYDAPGLVLIKDSMAVLIFPHYMNLFFLQYFYLKIVTGSQPLLPCRPIFFFHENHLIERQMLR